ncbi:hypothetical protein GWI33_005171 [Rhynchophorus ferrugineus]|uniref:Uncharacterized protein n=1 Tax=Rhynchophorus ferrugineus TaxID=354439 RepID=A0A834MEV9_RHYFE|nr:hypothetical protein GWI33_005171 [Rhynchophorus ferrugineus]
MHSPNDETNDYEFEECFYLVDSRAPAVGSPKNPQIATAPLVHQLSIGCRGQWTPTEFPRLILYKLGQLTAGVKVAGNTRRSQSPGTPSAIRLVAHILDTIPHQYESGRFSPLEGGVWQEARVERPYEMSVLGA